MTSTLRLLALLCLLAFFSACDQTEDPEITPPKPGENEIPQPLPRIKEITYYYNNAFSSKRNLEYDQQGRLVKVTYTSGDTIAYTYAPGKVFKKVYYSYDKSTVVYTYDLNDKGLAVYDTKDRYEYDEHGYRVRTISHLTHINTFKDGNNVRTADWVTSGGGLELLSVTDKTYLQDKPNTIGDENMGITFLGRQNKNPLIKEVFSDVRNNQVKEELTTTWQYEYDASNRIVKSSIPYGDGAYYRYTYVE